MKNSNILLLGIAAVGVYLWSTRSKGDATNYVTTSEWTGLDTPSVPLPPEYMGLPRASTTQEQSVQKFLDTSAQNNQTVTFKDNSGKIVGVQDANLGMSYRIEADQSLLRKASPSSAVVPIKIVGTPYTTINKAVAEKVNNPLAVAAANLKKKSLR